MSAAAGPFARSTVVLFSLSAMHDAAMKRQTTGMLGEKLAADFFNYTGIPDHRNKFPLQRRGS